MKAFTFTNRKNTMLNKISTVFSHSIRLLYFAIQYYTQSTHRLKRNRWITLASCLYITYKHESKSICQIFLFCFVFDCLPGLCSSITITGTYSFVRGRLYFGHCSLFLSLSRYFRKSLVKQILSIGRSVRRAFIRRREGERRLVYITHLECTHQYRLYSFYYRYNTFLFLLNCPADIQCLVSILGFFISSCQHNSRPRGSKAKRPPVQLKRTEMEHYGPIQFSSHKRTKLPAVYFRNMMLPKAYTNTAVNEINVNIFTLIQITFLTYSTIYYLAFRM